MTQLIKIIKMPLPFGYYLQLIPAGLAVLLCVYMMSVSADENRTVKTSFSLPSKLTVLNRQKQTTPSTLAQKSLQLEVNVAKQLRIRDSEVQWQIQQNGEIIRNLQGSQHAVALEEGLYQVHLQIGKYSVDKHVLIQKGQQVRPYFPLAVGRLQVSADYPVDWQLSRAGSGGALYKTTNQQSINEIVPAGEYQVKTISPVMAVQQTINIVPGRHSSQHLTIPLGKVNLIAIRNNQPLLQAMKWEVFRLGNSNRHKVGEYYLHTKSITMPPGQYEAVARHQGKVSKRRFLVRKETTNKVVLVMD